MDEVTNGNPAKCYEMFRMTPELLLHLVDELAQHGYLVDSGLGEVNATQAVAMLLYILGHNTHFRYVANRFQHSTETVCWHFCKALRAVHHYAKHLIKPDQNVTGLPEHLQVNKYWPWFERCIGAIDGMHVSARPPANETQAHRDHKSQVSTNVLCVCNMDMQFTFVHGGWEGSANDSRVRSASLVFSAIRSASLVFSAIRSASLVFSTLRFAILRSSRASASLA